MCAMIADTQRILRAAWSSYALGFPSRFHPEHGGLEFSCAGIGVALFNLAYPKTEGRIDDEQLERLLQEFRGVLAPRGVPGLLIARTDRLEGAGTGALFLMPGMVAQEFLPARQELPREEIREVRGAQMAAEIARLNAEAHELTPRDAAQMSCEGIWRAPNHGFLLYKNGVAVTGGAVSFVEGASYVGWMATDAGHRGYGYAEAVLRHMDAFMRKEYGVKESVLHATEMGRPIYERVGYRTVDEYAAYLCVAETGVDGATAGAGHD
jgi:ribosomal protein S18 acetylase RimI-like enzyme